jgi:hypothetical protein
MSHEHDGSQELKLSEEEQQQLDADIAALKAYGEAHQLRQLEGRTKHGLDPSGMLAVPESRALAARIAEKLGTTIDGVEGFITALHTQGPWKNIEKLKNGGTTPEAKFYLSLGGICVEKETTEGMTSKEYLADRSRVMLELGVLGGEDRQKAEALTAKNLKERIYEMEDKEIIDVDGVKIPAAKGYPFIGMAAEGYQGGISKTGDDADEKTVYFAATENIRPESVESIGLVPAYAEVFNPEKQIVERFAIDSEQGKTGRVVFAKPDEAQKPLEERAGTLKRISPGYYLAYHDKQLAAKLLATELKNRKNS